MWHIYKMEYHSAMKRNKTVPFTDTVIQREIRKRKKNCLLTLICGIQKMVQMNLFESRSRDTGIEDKSMDRKVGKEGAGINWETGMDKFTLLCII